MKMFVTFYIGLTVDYSNPILLQAARFFINPRYYRRS